MPSPLLWQNIRIAGPPEGELQIAKCKLQMPVLSLSKGLNWDLNHEFHELHETSRCPEPFEESRMGHLERHKGLFLAIPPVLRSFSEVGCYSLFHPNKLFSFPAASRVIGLP